MDFSRRKDRLTALIRELEDFRLCGPSDDPDEQTAVIVGYRHLLVQLKRLAAPVLSRDDATRLSTISVEPDDIYSVYDARAEVEALLPEIEEALSRDGGSEAAPVDDVWALVHPEIRDIAMPRFEAGHFADAVEAALKEVNSVVKDRVRQITGQELDGAGLMTTAFSARQPILALADLTTESGRNIQQGYMSMFSGAMVGIRNPKAHANLVVGAERALHLLVLASLLMYKAVEAEPVQQPPPA